MRKKVVRRRPFVQLEYELLESPAVARLSRMALLILLRVIVEYGRHKGKTNGRLVIARADLVSFGVNDDGKQIKNAWDELTRHGLVVRTVEGGWKPGSRWPHQWRVTFLASPGCPATNEWRECSIMEKDITEAVLKLREQREKTENSRVPTTREIQNSRVAGTLRGGSSRVPATRVFAGSSNPSSIHTSTTTVAAEHIPLNGTPLMPWHTPYVTELPPDEAKAILAELDDDVLSILESP